METKKAKTFRYDGLGFPIILMNITLMKKRGIWTPAIDYNKLQKVALIALSRKPVPLTGNEIHFIRTYFEMTFDAFGKQFGVTHAAVIKWEKAKSNVAKIDPTTELYIRLMILEKLHIDNDVFRATFQSFDMQTIAKESKKPSEQAKKPVYIPGSDLNKTKRIR